jgi:hypothetical protein
MKSTTQLEKENLIPVGKCLLLPGGILFVIGLVLRLSTFDDILFFCGRLRCNGNRPYCHEEVGIYPSGYRLVTTKNILLGSTLLQIEKEVGRGLHFLGHIDINRCQEI